MGRRGRAATTPVLHIIIMAWPVKAFFEARVFCLRLGGLPLRLRAGRLELLHEVLPGSRTGLSVPFHPEVRIVDI